MGGVTQKVHQTDSNIYSEVKPLMTSKKQFSSLGFTDHDISEIYEVFAKIDVDRSYEITLEELLVFLKAEVTPFIIAIFRCFDHNHNQKIDIKEFILAVWNYCTLNHARLCGFIFTLYDKDGSGIMDRGELANMLRDSYGPSYETNSNVMRLIARHERDAEDLTLEYFCTLIKSNSAILYPACLVQTKLKTTICGLPFWARIEKVREKLFGEEYIPLELILKHEGRRELIDQDMKAKHEKQTKIKHERAQSKRSSNTPSEPAVSDKQFTQQRRVSVLQKLYWVTDGNDKKGKKEKGSNGTDHDNSSKSIEKKNSSSSHTTTQSNSSNVPESPHSSKSAKSKKYKVTPHN